MYLTSMGRPTEICLQLGKTCWFPLPLGIWEGLRFVIVALPGIFSYLFLLSLQQVGIEGECFNFFCTFICFSSFSSVPLFHFLYCLFSSFGG